MLTKKNLEQLAKNCQYNPEKMGLAILNMLGYKITKYNLSGAIYVESKDNKKILWYDSGAYVD